MKRAAPSLLTFALIIHTQPLTSGLRISTYPHLKPLISLQGHIPPNFDRYRGSPCVRNYDCFRIHGKTWLNSEMVDDEAVVTGSTRNFFRKITGMSLSATRASLRATFGISLTAIRASLRAATGISISEILKSIVGIFPLWVRYFMQPFLVLYYTPLLILRELVGRRKGAKKEARLAHEKVVDGFKSAIEIAQAANKDDGYWPVRVNEDGWIEGVLPPDPDNFSEDAASDVTDAVTKSVIIAASIENSNS